ncbi:MAG TPA: NADH-quinone oxidoreductase subunit C, partial [Amaricoccus sp.]|nr:NADH-quinone oxidoreductase subunit C [Amaricoccus sp.]
MDATALDDLKESIGLRRGDAVLATGVAYGELTVTIAAASIPSFIAFLRTDATCRFTTLIDISAVDWPQRERRFDLVYHFLS